MYLCRLERSLILQTFYDQRYMKFFIRFLNSQIVLFNCILFRLEAKNEMNCLNIIHKNRIISHKIAKCASYT
ncbi:hypothetical protein BpHYR1_030437 [Brachionus plicatilis]|uniref:Uncharacterized protein n=1 Tax=Brachionus plicatilis TaxID=10195 RepID=A0A3M7R611_BRAPC|nr:hypothetical protein BpHYR1_030437 [Brachionus plicatilis]